MKYRFVGSCGHGYVADECEECPEYEDCKELLPFEDGDCFDVIKEEMDRIIAERAGNSGNEYFDDETYC